MSGLTLELKALIDAIDGARQTGDASLLAQLSSRKERLCALLAALDP